MNAVKELTNANLNAGFVCAANDRMADSQYSEALTNFAAGVRDESAQKLLDFIAPAIRSGRRFEFRKQKDAVLWTDDSDLRAVGADFKRLSVEGEIENSSTLNRGLVVRIDNDERYDGIEEEKTQALIQRLIRSECKRAVALLKAAAGSATAKSWLTGTSKTDPDSDLVDLASSLTIGVDANRMVFGRSAWNARFKAYRASETPYAGAAARDGAAQIADMIGVEAIYRSSERYATKAGKNNEIFTSNYVIAFVGCDKPVEGVDTSVVKRFWTPCEGGEMFRVYREERAKYIDITVEHYSRLLTTVADGAKAITVS